MTTPAGLPALLIPLDAPDLTLEAVGGKALNLARLARAGFPVPDGFFIPTTCYQDFINQNKLTTRIMKILVETSPTSPEALSSASQEIRTLFERGTVSQEFRKSLEEGRRWLGTHPVAVRSSATAEDLPGLSFAGQHDTYLNLIGDQAILDAVIGCWSSLWTGRAIGYRARNNISHTGVSLCVVVQNMVPADASGVLFTANPLTGCRTEMVIDATLGLGEALVGGHVEPDHYVVAISGVCHQDNPGPSNLEMEITHKSLGSKSLVITGGAQGGVVSQQGNHAQQQAIPDEVILRLAKMGCEIADLYASPQDIEWAYESFSSPIQLTTGEQGKITILQSRPITSLFPLPVGMAPEPLRCMFGFHAVQGILEPFTPLGQDTIKLVLTGGGQVFKLEYTLETQTAFYSAAERLWINFTPLLRSPLGHKIFPRIIQEIDPGIAVATQKLSQDPRFMPAQSRPSLSTIRRLVSFALPFIGRVLLTLFSPDRQREATIQAFDRKVKQSRELQVTSGHLWGDFARRMALLHQAKDIFSDLAIPKGVPLVVAGMATFFGILERFSREAANTSKDPQYETLCLEIARGLPHNVTTEMDLALWQVAQTLQTDPLSAGPFKTSTAETLAAAYLGESLSPTAQKAIAEFLEAYGDRCLGEIDIGRVRWREDPTHIMGVLQSYLKINDPTMAPDAVFERGIRAAAEAADKLVAAVRKLPGGVIKARIVRFGIGRYRALAGMREAPKFFAIRMMGIVHRGIHQSGQDLVKAGYLQRPDDLFFLYINELDQIAAEKTIPPDFPDRIRERRELREGELLRKQIPGVLLSDGTAFYGGVPLQDGEVASLVGDPVSPGVVEGPVRVVFDPQKTHLEPSEILVCPGTDPAWTPLFLAAGGLVMEVGGMMTHGSVVAREYGIPAVVGVYQATTRLKTGQRVRVDGSSGVIEIIS
jgi:phosphohistidine swiveling domain-containing protein